MGVLDQLDVLPNGQEYKKMVSLSMDAAEIMLTTAKGYQAKTGKRANIDICKGALIGRSTWAVTKDHRLFFLSSDTGFIIDESTTLLDTIKHVIRIEWEADSVIDQLPFADQALQLALDLAEQFVNHMMYTFDS